MDLIFIMVSLESDENPGETMIKEMIARKRKARMEKKEQEGIKVQELAKSIVENNDGKSIKKVLTLKLFSY